MRACSLIVGALLLGWVATAAAQTTDPALTAAIAARDKAAVARNADEVAKYTADDYAAINPSGVLNTKKQRIDGLRVPAAPGVAPQPAQVAETVRMYGSNVAVARMTVPTNRQLIVWVKNPQGWQAAAIHVVPHAAPDAISPRPRPTTAQPTPVTPPPGLSADGAAVFATFKQIQDAFYAGDRATSEKLKAPEFVRIMPGTIRFGSETNAGVEGFREQPKYSNVSVQVWGPVGVVRWLETTAAGQQQWFTRVFAKNGSGWLQVVTASCMAGKPPVAP